MLAQVSRHSELLWFLFEVEKKLKVNLYHVRFFPEENKVEKCKKNLLMLLDSCDKEEIAIEKTQQCSRKLLINTSLRYM